MNDIISTMESPAFLEQLTAALPSHLTPERVLRVARTAAMDEKLAACTRDSVILGMIEASQLGLEVNSPLQQAYLIPYKGRASLQIGYKGLMDLARQSGLVQRIWAQCVYANEHFYEHGGTEPRIDHRPLIEDRGVFRAVYAVARMPNNDTQFVVLSKEDVEKVRTASQTGNVWQQWYEEMAKKTAIKRLCKMLPRSTEMATAINLDDLSQAGERQVYRVSRKDLPMLDHKPAEPEPQVSDEDLTAIWESKQAEVPQAEQSKESPPAAKPPKGKGKAKDSSRRSPKKADSEAAGDGPQASAPSPTPKGEQLELVDGSQVPEGAGMRDNEFPQDPK